ncbi:hypothetical protein [Aestuariivita boseongensis]|uniref:hypothetical protein n=1 Tax=Aestuariivita boseongensis TaxID=1470562 RepID=UPI0006800AFF|nr:hypothetical protein [Aestuariivita boseongensis]
MAEATAPAGSGTALASDGKVLIRLSDLVRSGPGGRLLARVTIPENSAPVLGPDARDPAHRLLWQLVFEGRAAGNHGDLYENRDRGHSTLPVAAHPQLTHVVYDAEAREAGLDYGLAGRVLFDAPVIGNSSTALTDGLFWRSQPRLALTGDGGALLLYQNYLAGQVHVYPEHRDHDPEHGDLFPANTPFYLVSQGSSGSDRPHLQALAMILAAMRPETKAFLRDNQLLAATVQMIFRRSLASVLTRGAYLSGVAHPSVIPGDQINLSRMVSLANAFTPETVPPMVRMSVLSETGATEGTDYFGEGLSERLFDTPVAISRIWRSTAARREMVVSVEATRDPFGRKPEFSWRLLRGDPERTRIEPLDGRGTRARITFDWQLPRPVSGRPDVLSNRIDVGVFARTGEHDSMPGLISLFLPHHETRRYGQGPKGALRIESVDYRPTPEGYADPLLFPRADWRDDYIYSDTGKLSGWSRSGQAGTARFDSAGQRITHDGTVAVRHLVEASSGKAPSVVFRDTKG